MPILLVLVLGGLAAAAWYYKDSLEAGSLTGSPIDLLNTGKDDLLTMSSAGSTPKPPTGVELAPALRKLREQIDSAYPRRNKSSDSAEDTAEASEHSQGLALDISLDPINGPNLDALATVLANDRRVAYVIWNGQVYTRGNS